MQRGDSAGVCANGLSAVKWMDTRSVILLSNFHCPNAISNVTRREKKSSQKIRLSCPVMVSDYNAHMGGVDLTDQLKVTYELDRKHSFRFYLRVFFDLMDIAVVNAYVIFRKLRNEKQMTLFDFNYIVCRGLIGGFNNRQRSIPYPRQSKRHCVGNSDETSVRHMPVFVEKRLRCYRCSKEGKEQRTFVRCDTCNIALCLLKERNCFFRITRSNVHVYCSFLI